MLKREVVSCRRHRVRICTHPHVNAALHEMFVCYSNKVAIQPHKHLGKDEIFHVLEGLMDVILYNDTGDVQRVIRMGDYASGLPFCLRNPMDVFHSVVVRTPFAVLHEATPGPYIRPATVYASW